MLNFQYVFLHFYLRKALISKANGERMMGLCALEGGRTRVCDEVNQEAGTKAPLMTSSCQTGT